MTAGGALLIALLLQGAIGAPGNVPQAAPTRARLELRGAVDCISRGELAARVAARSPRIQFADDAEIYARVVLTSARPGNVMAELVLATAGAEQPPRRFVARSCAEAADAVALIIAVTLDPTADTSAQPPPAPPPPAIVIAAPPAPVPAPARAWRFGAYAAGQTIFGPAPDVMPGIAVYGMAALDGDGLWAPALFVGGTHAWRSDLSEPGGTASFTLDAGSVDACPLRLGGRSRFAARPCASALVGRLAASGADTDQPSSAARPFATAGAALALTAGLGSTVEISARLGVGVTLLRDTYDFGGVTFHRAGAVTSTASVGVGLRWP